MTLSNAAVYVLITTFLASAVEAIEMVTIVVGVGATRGWRSSLTGAAAGFVLLAVVIVGLGAALSHIPIGALRTVVGALLLIFGLQWFTKGVRRVAARGFAGMREQELEDHHAAHRGIDWTAFVLSFKGVVLEGIEVAFIVVSFGANANQLGLAVIGGVAAIVVIGGIGAAVHRAVMRIPRSVLQLVVGVMLTTFGTFWSLEGVGVDWPAGDASILWLLGFYALVALTYIALERRRLFGLVPAA
ncbi:MAG: hypothetical protein JOZ46_12720 [Candidatus Dormibacteraeota bacterium]|nr:hypothetical protein [Candidatus Dormibacteraeota bacterium]MBV9526665.1 hypothetical protein [Candidatus Dormibacteraeota bacterium]